MGNMILILGIILILSIIFLFSKVMGKSISISGITTGLTGASSSILIAIIGIALVIILLIRFYPSVWSFVMTDIWVIILVFSMILLFFVVKNNKLKILAGIIFLTLIFNYFSYCNKSKEEEIKQEAVGVNIGYHKTYYALPAKGFLEVNIQNTDSLYTYPQGGPVHIIPPSGKDYIDIPGVKEKHPREEAGVFKFDIPKDSKANGIEIWQ